MRKKILYLWAIAAFIHAFMLVACEDGGKEELAIEMSLKSYMPTTVMTDCEIVITGTNLERVTSLLFPGDVEVTDFEVVTSNQIKALVPAGIAEEGGTLKIVSSDKVLESSALMRLAAPRITAMDPGDEVKEGQELTFKGEDLEYIKQVQFPSADDDQYIVIDAMNFVRKSSDNVKVKVPVGVKNGVVPLNLIAIDGTIVQSPEINIAASAKDPEGTITCTIQHAASSLYLTRNMDEDAPRIMSSSGKPNQRFVFTPVTGEPQTYYIKNKEADEYLVCGDENDWRMQWVTDPNSISNPAKGMYQVVQIDGNTEYVQIKNIGSNMLGTDGTEENSEVYADKSTPTEPKYQWKINVISGPGFNLSVLREDEPESGDWHKLELR